LSVSSSTPVFSDHRWLQFDDDLVGKYNAIDCVATARVHHALCQEQRDNHQYTHFREVFWPMVGHIVELQKRGMPLDVGRLMKYGFAVKEEIKDTEAAICADAVVDPGLNFNSTRQVAKLLFEDLGLKSFKTTDSGGLSTDQEALDRCLRNLRKKDEHARPVLEALFHRSRLKTIRDRYLKMPTGEDGRVRPTIKAGKAETLRLAYANPALQQMPKEIRHVFVAKPGHVFVAIDYSQLEARILAVLSGDQTSLDIFLEGGDVHKQNAIDLRGFSEQEWERLEPRIRSQNRNLAKTFLYGISYGGKAETLKAKMFCPCPKCADKVPDTLSLSRNDMKAAELRWFAKHSAVKWFREELDELAKNQGIKRSYTTPFGYKRIFFNPYPDVMTEVYNFPMQATAAGLMNRSFVEAMEAGLPIVLQMHDELVMECPRDEALGMGRQLKEIMERPVAEMGGTVFPVDAKWGESWGEMEEVGL